MKIIRVYINEIKLSIHSLNRVSPNIIIFIVYGLLYDMVINIYKPFAGKFLQRLGGNDLYFSLYSSLPALVAVFVMLPGSLFISKFKNKKIITAVFFVLSRSLLLLIATVPFFPKEIQPLLFVLIFSLMNFPDALSQNSFQGYLGIIFTGRVRAQAISLRNKFANIFVLIITLIAGMIISYFPKTDSERIICYQIFFVASFVFGMAEIFVFSKFKEENITESQVPKTTFKGFFETLKNKKFLKFLLRTLLFLFAWHSGWAVNTIYQVKVLGANEIWIAGIAIASGLGAFLSADYWGKTMYKKGNEHAFVLAMFALAFNMLFCVLSPNLLVFTIVQLFAGFATVGFNITLLNSLLNATPDENRLIYLAVFNMFSNMSLFIAPLLALMVLTRYGIYFTLYVVFFLRALASLYNWYTYDKEKKALKL